MNSTNAHTPRGRSFIRRVQRWLRVFSKAAWIILKHARQTLENVAEKGGEQRSAILIDIQSRVAAKTILNLLFPFLLVSRKVLVRVRLSNFASIADALRRGGLLGNRKVRLYWGSRIPAETEIVFSDASEVSWKHVRLAFHYQPEMDECERRLVLPYLMSPHYYFRIPSLHRMPYYRARERTVRLLFAGRCGEEYDRPEMLEHFGVLNRFRILQHLRASGRLMEVQNLNELEALYNGPYRNQFLFIDTEKFHIPRPRWMHFLARTEFFLCPPGLAMPMCHNAVESLALGTIPIINYGDWFFPSLSHLRTCIAFSGLADLDTQLESIDRMAPDQIAALRKRATSYYVAHMDLEGFAHRLLRASASPEGLHVLDE